jgi:hypothetical protein
MRRPRRISSNRLRIVQGVALQVVHHHVHRLVLAEEVQHRNHARVADLRQAAAFLEEALQAQAVQRLLVGLDPRREFPGRAFGQRGRQVLFHRHQLLPVAFGQIDDAEASGCQLLDDRVAPDHRARRQRRRLGLRHNRLLFQERVGCRFIA